MNAPKLLCFFFILSFTSIQAQSDVIYNKVSVFQDGEHLSAYINPYTKSTKVTLKNRRYFYFYKLKISSLEAGHQGNVLHGRFERMDEQKRLKEEGMECARRSDQAHRIP